MKRASYKSVKKCERGWEEQEESKIEEENKKTVATKMRVKRVEMRRMTVKSW